MPGLFQRARCRLSAALQNDLITIRTIFVFFPGMSECELLNQICWWQFGAAAEEKEL